MEDMVNKLFRFISEEVKLEEKGKVEEKKEIKEAEEVSTKEVGAEESKEYFGKAKDQYYYFVKRGSKYAIQDATGNDVLTSEEGETLEQFLIDSIKDLDLEDIAYEIVDKYLLPKEEPKEEEKPEEEKPEEEEKPKAERPEEGPKEEKPEEGTEEIKPEEPKPEEPEAEEPKEPVESIQKKKVSDFTDVEEREEPADREEFKITGEELRNYWATGKPLIVGDKEYSVHRMSYGDYFLEPFGKERGETEGFAPGTIWLKKIDSQKDIYGILEKRVGREEESIEEVGKEEKSKGTQASASGEYGIAVSDIAKEVFKVAEDTDVFELLDSKAVYDYIRKRIKKDIAEEGAKNVSVVDVEFVETDSSNISHAFSYYSVTLNGPKEELAKVVGEDKIIIGEVSEQVCPGSKIRSRGKGRGLGRGRGRGPIGIPIGKKRVSEAEEDEVFIDALKKALDANDEGVRKLVGDAFYQAQIKFAKSQTLPAMLRNDYAPAFGWSAEFRRVDDYLSFIDELYGEKGKAKELLRDYVEKNIRNYADTERIKYYKYEYERDWKIELASEIVAEFSLDDVIDILADIIEKDMKAGKIDVEKYIEENWDWGALYDELYSLSPIEIWDMVEEYGDIEKLKKLLRKYISKSESIEETSMSTEDLINMAVKRGWTWREFVERVPALNTEEVKEIFRRKGGKVNEAREVIADEKIAGKEYFDRYKEYIKVGDKVWEVDLGRGEKIYFKDKDRAEYYESELQWEEIGEPDEDVFPEDEDKEK